MTSFCLPSDKTSRFRLLPLVPVVVIALVLDQFTKWLIMREFPVGGGMVVIPGFFDLVHFRNTGAAFGVLAGGHIPWRLYFFLGMTPIALIIILWLYIRTQASDQLQRWSLSLIFGGASGNFVDRLIHGEVVDFLYFYVGSFHWPAFNVADSCISVGCVLLLISILRS